ncbi:hypothetical protein EW146_g7581 [Bondarzewia mesenterica]|uniref:Uncharacterized protein n=1 Tax=Bondarzewia mesenterica TaxID=1095465 RepID=A0A4S4LKE3_9AGAM|nr:hypothetical protein EW146_g7581 [Bondarzewia mesenterica]
MSTVHETLKSLVWSLDMNGVRKQYWLASGQEVFNFSSNYISRSYSFALHKYPANLQSVTAYNADMDVDDEANDEDQEMEEEVGAGSDNNVESFITNSHEPTGADLMDIIEPVMAPKEALLTIKEALPMMMSTPAP